MRLRNKKTGEIVDLSEGFIKDTYSGEFILIKPVAISNKEVYLYGSLAELNEEWEDYKPAEPLIPDAECRKIMRLWADRCGIKAVTLFDLEFRHGSKSICFGADFGLEHPKSYTIDELCGHLREEEE